MRRGFHLLALCSLAAGAIAAGCGGDDSEEGDQPAADSCTRAVQSAPQLSAELEEELTSICEDARGDAEATRDAARRVCVRVIEETLPAGAAADQAMEACGDEP